MSWEQNKRCSEQFCICQMRMHYNVLSNMSVEDRKCSAGLAGAHSSLQDRILLNCTRIENSHKVRKKTFVFLLLCIAVQRTYSFPFSLLRHYQIPECFYVNNCCFWACATVLSCYRHC